MSSTQKRRSREPQQARSLETRAKILQAALTAFAEHGFAAANIRDIAEKAGATHPMITYHFGGKDKLWRAAVEEMFLQLRREVNVSSAEMSSEPVRAFKQLVVQYVRYCARHPEHARITISETVAGGARLKWMVQKFVKRDHEALLPILEDLMKSGILPQTDPMAFLYSFVGMCQLPFVLAQEAKEAFGVSIVSEKQIVEHTETVFQLLFRESAKPYL